MHFLNSEQLPRCLRNFSAEPVRIFYTCARFFFLNKYLNLWVIFTINCQVNFLCFLLFCVLFGFWLYLGLVTPYLNCFKLPCSINTHLSRVLHVYPSTPEGLTVCGRYCQARACCKFEPQACLWQSSGGDQVWNGIWEGVGVLRAFKGLNIYIWLKVTVYFITGRLNSFNLLHS